jgi:hypothetical protein
MDTFPLVVLQQSEGFRTDVAVVNAALLNWNWYAALMITRHEIAGGFTAGQTADLHYQTGPAGNSISRQIISRWMSAARKGKLSRPLAIGIGVAWKDLVSDVNAFTLMGSHWLCETGRKHRLYSLDSLWRSLQALNPADFRGEFVNSRDRSPIRGAYAPATAGGAVTGDLWFAIDALRGMGTYGVEEAEKLEDWVRRFDAGTETTVRE